jgi:hypothetical protein
MCSLFASVFIFGSTRFVPPHPVGLLLAFVIARLQHGYYFQIMLPGGMVGLIVGYATQRYGRDASQLQRS